MIDISKMTDEEFAAMEDALRRRSAELARPKRGPFEYEPAGKTEAKPIATTVPAVAEVPAKPKFDIIDVLDTQVEELKRSYAEFRQDFEKRWTVLQDQIRSELQRLHRLSLDADEPQTTETAIEDSPSVMCAICGEEVRLRGTGGWGHVDQIGAVEKHPPHDAEPL
jgi:hypothetical protein